MGHIDVDRHRHLAAGLAARELALAADGLERARSAEEFTAAIETNRRAWQMLGKALPALAPDLPSRLVQAGLHLAACGQDNLDDHKIELLIGIDRRISAAMEEIPSC